MRVKPMKFICVLSALVITALTFSACSDHADHSPMSVQRPPTEKCLTIYTPLPEEVYLPLVREFENRTGIWVEVENGSIISKLNDVASGEENEADLVFGTQSDIIERYSELFTPYDSAKSSEIPVEYTNLDGLWQPFTVGHLVVVYNSKLLREYHPTSWRGILLSGWNKQVAYVSPEKSDVGEVTVRTVTTSLGISSAELSSLLSPELEFDICEDVIEAISRGKCYFGVVTEDVAIRAIANNSDIDVIYPRDGTSLYASAVAIFDSAAHETNARRFIEFVHEKNVQDFIRDNFAMHSIYEQVEQIEPHAADTIPITYPDESEVDPVGNDGGLQKEVDE